MEFEDLESVITWNSSQRLGFHDVAELCGGAGDTAKLLIKRGYSGWPNFDVVCGINLLVPCNKTCFLRYLSESKPAILLINRPCTGMKRFNALNRAIHHAGSVRSQRISVPLGNLAGIAAMAYLQAGRHFIAEHPQSSDLWKLPVWREISRHCNVARVLLHQCMVGLTGRRSGMPMLKPTEF